MKSYQNSLIINFKSHEDSDNRTIYFVNNEHRRPLHAILTDPELFLATMLSNAKVQKPYTIEVDDSSDTWIVSDIITPNGASLLHRFDWIDNYFDNKVPEDCTAVKAVKVVKNWKRGLLPSFFYLECFA